MKSFSLFVRIQCSSRVIISWAFTCLVAVCLSVLSATAMAQTVELDRTLSPDAPGGFFGNAFGAHVASDENWLFVGAARESVDTDGDGILENSVGVVRAYKRNSKGKIINPERPQLLVGETARGLAGPLGVRHGAGIAVSGDYLFVAVANGRDFGDLIDPLPDPDVGSFFFAGQVWVYVKDKGKWEGPVQKLISDVPTSNWGFGGRTESRRIALFEFGHGEQATVLAAIGEHENIGNNGTAPKIHIFKLTNGPDGPFERIQIFGPPLGQSDSFLGDQMIALDDHLLLFAPSTGGGRARAHVYRLNEDGVLPGPGSQLVPVQTAALPEQPDPGCLSSGAIGGGGGIVVITEPCAGPGAAFVYNFDPLADDPLTLSQTLESAAVFGPRIFGSHAFGSEENVATDGQLIAIGSSDLGESVEVEELHIYARNGNVFSPVLLVPSPNPLDFSIFGLSTTFIGNGQLAVGQMNLFGVPGAVYIYNIN